MNRSFTPPLTKFSLKLILMGLALFIFVYSCKKEISSGEEIDLARKKELLAYKNGPRVEVIQLAQFQKKANLNALGTLKQEFVSASPLKSKIMAISTSETYLGFNIITDSIKMISANGHTIYVFPVALASKRAVTFQNLTIDESAAGTVAFVNTYTPTKKWIAEWKKGHPGKFDGDISVTYLNLNNGTAPSPTTGSSTKNPKAGVSSSPNTIANVQICTTTNYFYEVPYACGSGQHFPGDSGCALVGDARAGYFYIDFDITTCVDDPNQGGGSGGTTPTPPGTYNPCPTTPPLISSKKSLGNKIMVVPPTPCDSVVIDCAGVRGGNAYINPNCNTCMGGTTGITACPTGEIKTDSLNKKFPCAKILIIDKLTGISAFVNMIAPFQGSGEVPNLNWDSKSLDWGSGANSDMYKLGETENTQGWSSTIYLNSSAIQNASSLFVATAAIHETAHAYSTYLTKKNIYFPNQNSGSWANDIEYWSITDSLSKAGQGNYIDHSNFLESYFDRMVDIIQEYDASLKPKNDYRMAMLYGMNNPGDAPNPNTSSSAEIIAFNKRASKLTSIYNKILTKYQLTPAQINTFYNNNVKNVPASKRLQTNCQ